jgi:hypothetical protein
LEFCKLLDESIQVYNELSPSMRQQLSRQMKRKASDADSNEVRSYTYCVFSSFTNMTNKFSF